MPTSTSKQFTLQKLLFGNNRGDGLRKEMAQVLGKIERSQDNACHQQQQKMKIQGAMAKFETTHECNLQETLSQFV